MCVTYTMKKGDETRIIVAVEQFKILQLILLNKQMSNMQPMLYLMELIQFIEYDENNGSYVIFHVEEL